MTIFFPCGVSITRYKCWIQVLLFCLVTAHAEAQGNNKPKITGQSELNILEEQPITIQLTHLTVEDRDDWFYPWGFTMKLYPGSDYTLSGNVVTPALNFSGTLKVPVTVNDGQNDSNQFDIRITVTAVNDKPVITAHTTLTTNEGQPISIKPEHFTVTDPDDSYPRDFTLKVLAGAGYTTDGTNVTPQAGFAGSLTVNVLVNDGAADSDPYSFPIQVNAVNRIPEIISQSLLQVNEDASLNVLFSDLTVVDRDSNYPQGFTMTLAPGSNYSISNYTVTPTANFFGKITVPVTVSDGKNTSKPYNLSITVIPTNDLPIITMLETEPVYYGLGNLTIPVTQTLTVSDADEDSIMYAEVGIKPDGFNRTFDKLVFSPPANSKIRGVFDPATGLLTLLGQASLTSYTRAIRSVNYNSLADQPSGNKTLYFIVNDGKSNSDAVERRLVYGEAIVSLEIPSGFTPNGDAANDTWKIIPVKTSGEYSNARIRVYNKAGRIVYESVGFEHEWDGRMNGELLPADTYFYTIDLNLKTPQGFVKGVVTILR